MITIAEIIGRVNTQLKDTAWLRWPLAELCDYYNDAIRATILARPDAGATTDVITTEVGTKPASVIVLLTVCVLLSWVLKISWRVMALLRRQTRTITV
ncbi:hypothetical protein VYJ26_001770 [Yersinia enterocolitica]|nr:hypothetical protein [Yersinia enterocolitica]